VRARTTHRYGPSGPTRSGRLIYKPAEVTPVGSFEIFDSSDDPRFIDTLNRPGWRDREVAQDNLHRRREPPRSRPCNAVSDLTRDWQTLNLTRAASPGARRRGNDRSREAGRDFLIVGGLNSCAMEDRSTRSAG
jgi:hypothetical protein